jgi:TolB protein
MQGLGMVGLILGLAACAPLSSSPVQDADNPQPGAAADAGDASNQTRPEPQYNTTRTGAQVAFDAPERQAAVGGASHAAAPAAGQPGTAPLSLELYGQLPVRGMALSGPADSQDNFCQMSFAAEGADFDPVVDPSGTSLVFASTRQRRTADIYIQKIGGAAVTQLTGSAGNSVMPALSPDGKKIAFCSDRGGKWDLYLMDATGGPAVQLTTDPSQNIHPSFSPDSKRLVYSSYSSPSAGWELVVIDLDNPAAQHHIGYGLFPNWAPQGDKIVFQKPRERGTRWFSIWTLEYVNGEGVRPTALAVSANAAAINPQWSPDGRQIVFSTVFNPSVAAVAGPNPGASPAGAGLPTQADVWVMNADGTGRTNLTRSRFLNVQPTWGHDGSIYFVSDRSNNSVQNIWSIRASALNVAAPVAAKAAPAARAAQRVQPPATQPEAKAPEPIAAPVTAEVPTP